MEGGCKGEERGVQGGVYKGEREREREGGTKYTYAKGDCTLHSVHGF